LNLYHSDRTFGVDLDFRDSPSAWWVDAEGGPQLMKGQAVGLYITGGGWLTLGDPTFGIGLGFADHPSYEWYILGGGSPGDPLSSGRFALWNGRKHDFLVYDAGSAGSLFTVTLNWNGNILDSGGSGGTPTDPGARFYQMYNCSADNATVSVWIQDETLGEPFARKGQLAPTGCGPSGGSVPFSFDPPAHNHRYRVVAVDQQRNGCSGDNPTDGFCQALLVEFVSNRQSDTVSGVKQWQGYLRTDAINGITQITMCTPAICGTP
jgi:hypothetical protein